VARLFLRVFTLSPRQLKVIYPIAFAGTVIAGSAVGMALLSALGVR
jgi:hypothetical protein